MLMKKNLIVLIVLAVAALFYWQFFAPVASPIEVVTGS
ncbi:MAG: hypothetical protein Greene041679_71 [Parcubacteria group bacterium Greene0416_79]|nr:MAG: hypothetical protein Greene041679_71 [Parcubacteria group bacterium Greene0416_79]